MMDYQTKLEFTAILQKLCGYALSEGAKSRLSALEPLKDERQARLRIAETTAARKVLEVCGNPPLTSTVRLEQALALAQAGAMLECEMLMEVQSFLASSSRMVSYLKRAETADAYFSGWSGSLTLMPELRGEIERCIRNMQVDSAASPRLGDIRRGIAWISESVQERLASLLRGNSKYFSGDSAVQRDGRYALPVKRTYKSQVSGTVVGSSNTGETVFIEPSSVAKLQQQLAELRVDEDAETRRILYMLTAMVDDHTSSFKRNLEAIETLDVLFAKAKLSVDMDASPVNLTVDSDIAIIRGRHPLLPKDKCVPFDLNLTAQQRGVIITGPNTGGKTVAIKAIGLLHVMAQCGLHVTAAHSSTFRMFGDYHCDIGDGQSITENLSTFSSHMTSIVGILNSAGPESLVILDELGSGTDPQEGMGIAVAVLDALIKCGCTFLVTSHYPEIKKYAEDHPLILNARMAFDHEALAPTYQLEAGKSGESYALQIAQRLGLAQALIDRARQVAYREDAPTAQAQIAPPSLELPANKHIVHRLQRDSAQKTAQPPIGAAKFGFADSVLVFPKRESGIVFAEVNTKGEIGVQIQGVKRWIPYKRLKLVAKAEDLYPPDYDFSIVFDSVQTRKAHKKMSKRHVEGLSIELEKDEWRKK